jgi:hypothetical protein
MWMKASPIGVIHVRRQRLIWYPHPLEFWCESLGIHLLHDTVLRQAPETSRNIQKHRKLEVFLDTPTDTKTKQFYETTGRRAEKKHPQINGFMDFDLIFIATSLLILV